MDIRLNKRGMFNMVWENTVLALGRWFGWLKSNRNLRVGGGGGVGVDVPVHDIVSQHPFA